MKPCEVYKAIAVLKVLIFSNFKEQLSDFILVQEAMFHSMVKGCILLKRFSD